MFANEDPSSSQLIKTAATFSSKTSNLEKATKLVTGLVRLHMWISEKVASSSSSSPSSSSSFNYAPLVNSLSASGSFYRFVLFVARIPRIQNAWKDLREDEIYYEIQAQKEMKKKKKRNKKEGEEGNNDDEEEDDDDDDEISAQTKKYEQMMRLPNKLIHWIVIIRSLLEILAGICESCAFIFKTGLRPSWVSQSNVTFLTRTALRSACVAFCISFAADLLRLIILQMTHGKAECEPSSPTPGIYLSRDHVTHVEKDDVFVTMQLAVRHLCDALLTGNSGHLVLNQYLAPLPNHIIGLCQVTAGGLSCFSGWKKAEKKK